MIDIDAPIPYTLTAKGREALELAAVEDTMAACRHDFIVDLDVGMVCRLCTFECAPRKGARGYER